MDRKLLTGEVISCHKIEPFLNEILNTCDIHMITRGQSSFHIQTTNSMYLHQNKSCQTDFTAKIYNQYCIKNSKNLKSDLSPINPVYHIC